MSSTALPALPVVILSASSAMSLDPDAVLTSSRMEHIDAVSDAFSSQRCSKGDRTLPFFCAVLNIGIDIAEVRLLRGVVGALHAG
jgi:hypothetical protein